VTISNDFDALGQCKCIYDTSFRVDLYLLLTIGYAVNICEEYFPKLDDCKVNRAQC